MATNTQGHRIVFVTGKGGVGKSLVAAATALQLARSGKEVLLVEFGARSFYRTLFDLSASAVDGEPVDWRPGIQIARWDVESALREYVGHYLPLKAATNRIFGNAAMKALVAVAPSLSELALLGKLTAPMRHRWYQRSADVVVVDGYSTGQFLSLLRAPRGLAATVGGGPIHAQTEAMTALLRDPAVCEYLLVTLPEEMPIAEACEMAGDLRQETGLSPRVICNRLLDLPPRIPTLDAAAPAASFLHQMADLQRRQKRSLRTLAELELDDPVQLLPFVPSLDPAELVERLADALVNAAEAGA